MLKKKAAQTIQFQVKGLQDGKVQNRNFKFLEIRHQGNIEKKGKTSKCKKRMKK